MPKTKVTITEFEGSDGSTRTQYRTTIPKQLAEFFEMADADDVELEWTTGSARDKLEVTVHTE